MFTERVYRDKVVAYINEILSDAVTSQLEYKLLMIKVHGRIR